jgi:hypothetical protein
MGRDPKLQLLADHALQGGEKGGLNEISDIAVCPMGDLQRRKDGGGFINRALNHNIFLFYAAGKNLGEGHEHTHGS